MGSNRKLLGEYMPNWIQLKDEIAFAYVNSDNFVDNSILLDDSIDPNSIMGKKYVNGEYIRPPMIYFVAEMLGNKVLRVQSTIFPSDVTGDIVDENVKPMWTKNESGEYIPPANIGEATIYDEHLFE